MAIELGRHLDQDAGVLGEIVARDLLDAGLLSRHRPDTHSQWGGWVKE